EITPPVSCNADDLLRKAQPLAGLADAVNVTDGASARAHLSAPIAAALLARVGIEPILQFTCRDRNRIALQADLSGAAACGVHDPGGRGPGRGQGGCAPWLGPRCPPGPAPGATGAISPRAAGSRPAGGSSPAPPPCRSPRRWAGSRTSSRPKWPPAPNSRRPSSAWTQPSCAATPRALPSTRRRGASFS